MVNWKKASSYELKKVTPIQSVETAIMGACSKTHQKMLSLSQQMSRSLVIVHVVTFGFNLLDEGLTVKAAVGNYSVCALKETESYETLALGLLDIRKEVAEFSKEGITIG